MYSWHFLFGPLSTVLQVSEKKKSTNREETNQHQPFCATSSVSALFEVANDVLLFMQSETAETTSEVLCDPHSADLKEADGCQVYQRAKVHRGHGCFILAAQACKASRVWMSQEMDGCLHRYGNVMPRLTSAQSQLS